MKEEFNQLMKSVGGNHTACVGAIERILDEARANGMRRIGKVMFREDRVLAVEQSPHGHARLLFDTGITLDIPASYLEGACPFSVWQNPTNSVTKKTAS